MVLGGFSVYQKNVFERMQNTYICCCFLDYICTCSIVSKVEPRAHNEARTEPKPSEPGVWPSWWWQMSLDECYLCPKDMCSHQSVGCIWKATSGQKFTMCWMKKGSQNVSFSEMSLGYYNFMLELSGHLCSIYLQIVYVYFYF